MKLILDLLGISYKEQHYIPGIGLADFYIPSKNIAIEVDGLWWHSLATNVANDKRKDAAYSAAGITVVRISDKELEKVILL